jgi:penicillin-binding protein 1A
LKDLNRPIFGKTGTTTGPTNVWFVGGSADIVAGVYLGYDQPRSMGGGAQGGVIAAPIFKDFAKPAMAGMPVKPFRAAGGVRMVRIDRRSGKRVYGAFPNENDPQASVIWEAFKPESEPRRSIGADVAPTTAKPKAAARQAAPKSRPDSDFLEKQGGIY